MIDTNIIGARRAFGFGLAVMVALLVVLLAPSPAHAFTFTVDRSDDPNLTTTPTTARLRPTTARCAER